VDGCQKSQNSSSRLDTDAQVFPGQAKGNAKDYRQKDGENKPKTSSGLAVLVLEKNENLRPLCSFFIHIALAGLGFNIELKWQSVSALPADAE
jgi:hypothetical protein